MLMRKFIFQNVLVYDMKDKVFDVFLSVRDEAKKINVKGCVLSWDHCSCEENSNSRMLSECER